MTEQSRKENRRHQRDRVASLRGGYLDDTTQLRWVTFTDYIGEIRHLRQMDVDTQT